MARKEFLDYVWKICIQPQLGYSFSLNHTLPYSVIALQEMNLATKYNPLYWQCACLCVNAGNYADGIGEDDGAEEEDLEEVSEETIGEDKKKKAAPNYGKIGKAIADSQLSGVKIELPDINEAQEDFIPDVKNNAIIYSLSAINCVSDDLFERIIANRPYSSPQDFWERVMPTEGQMYGLLKSGCFDKLSTKPRQVIVEEFLQYISDKEIPLKDKITSVQLKKAISLKMSQLKKYTNEIRIYNFKQYLDSNCSDKTAKRYTFTDEVCVKFFNMFLKDKLNYTKEEYYPMPGGGIGIKSSALDREVKKIIVPILEYLNSSQGLQDYKALLQEEFIQERRNKYFTGSLAKWEMDTMTFYYHDHELKNVNAGEYNIKNFKELPEYPIDKECCGLVGTIINVNNLKRIVTILTIYGTVDVRFFAGHYTQYNQKISEIDPTTKKKTVLDDSWFKRGNKILVYGQRKENSFTARNCKINGYNRIVGLIEDVNLDGSLNIRYTRIKKK